MKLFDYIDSINKKNEKVLSVFLTAGYPNKDNFTQLAVKILNAGADMLEIGIPFSDPLADGPVIQYSSHKALENGIKVKDCIEYALEIKKQTDKPLIFMSYLNPLLSYGIEKFWNDSISAGVSGLIIPDLVPEEYINIIGSNKNDLDIILLSTPTTPPERLKKIDLISNGFIYFVSVNGTTGERNLNNEEILIPIKKAYKAIKKNKMLVGFGISNEESVKFFSPVCDGVIVGSAIVNKLDKPNGEEKAVELIKELKAACYHN
jgi:tryptophan synthase alpha chain